jgi:tRNA nucleotidyltransferase (CCA-adding enzyme)
MYLALLAYRLILPELDTLGTRLKLARDDVDLLHAVAALRDEIERFQVGDVRPSEVHHLLAPYSGPAILITWVATDSRGVREYLSRYWQDYRHVKPLLTGDDLRRMGFSPGPIFGRVLGALRDARLDGQIATKREEEQMAREMLDAASVS